MKKFEVSRGQLATLLDWLEYNSNKEFSELVCSRDVNLSDIIVRDFHNHGITRDRIVPVLRYMESSYENLWEFEIAGNIDGVEPKWSIEPNRTFTCTDKAVDMNPVELTKTMEEVRVHGDWIVDINYSKGPLNSHTNTYRLGEGYVEEEAVREAYTMFIAELGVEYSNSILASSDIVIVNARQLPTPSYRTIKLN